MFLSKKIIKNKYSIVEIIDVNNLHQSSINLSDIIGKKAEGIIIREWIEEEIISDVLKNIDKFSPPFPSPFGKVLGFPLNGAQNPDLTAYLSDVSQTEEKFSNLWGCDLKKRLADTFQKLSPNNVFNL